MAASDSMRTTGPGMPSGLMLVLKSSIEGSRPSVRAPPWLIGWAAPYRSGEDATHGRTAGSNFGFAPKHVKMRRDGVYACGMVHGGARRAAPYWPPYCWTGAGDPANRFHPTAWMGHLVAILIPRYRTRGMGRRGGAFVLRTGRLLGRAGCGGRRHSGRRHIGQ